MMLNRLHAKGGSDMGLAGARAADKHDVVGIVHELASVELSHEWTCPALVERLSLCSGHHGLE